MGSCAVLNECCKATIDVPISINNNNLKRRSKTCIAYGHQGKEIKSLDLELEQSVRFK